MGILAIGDQQVAQRQRAGRQKSNRTRLALRTGRTGRLGCGVSELGLGDHRARDGIWLRILSLETGQARMCSYNDEAVKRLAVNTNPTYKR